MSIIHDPEQSKKFAKQLVIFAFIMLILLSLSYLIPQSWIDNYPILIHIFYYSIPVVLFVAIFILIRKLATYKKTD